MDGARVAVVGERVQVAALRAAEHRLERLLGDAGELADRADSAAAELLGRDGADTPEPLDRKRVEEVELAVRRDEQQPVGLGDGARDLREELRPGDADRDRETDALAHRAS